MNLATDVCVIGAGPIGIELAVALTKARIDYLHLEAKQIGHTMSWWAPQTQWFSSNERIAIAGVPLYTVNQGKATREEYLSYLRTIVDTFDLEIRTYEPVIDIKPEAGGFTIKTIRGTHRAKRIVLATGGTDAPCQLGVPGEALPHVSHYFQDPHTYFRRDVCIIGGKNSAIEAALRCYHAGARVHVSYRKDHFPEQHIKYWLMPEMKSLINAGKIQAHFRTTPVEITPSYLIVMRDGDRMKIPADFVLALTGYVQDKRLYFMAGVQLQGEDLSPVHNADTMETNVSGIYVAGTAVGGTQHKYSVFLENCHVHVDRIVRALQGQQPPAQPTFPELVES